MCFLRKRKELERQRDFYQQRFNEILAKYDDEQKKNAQLETDNFEQGRTIKELRDENEVLTKENKRLSEENLAKHNIITEDHAKMKNLQKKLEKLQKENPATRVEAKKPGEPRKKEQKPEKPTSRLESSERKVDHDSYVEE